MKKAVTGMTVLALILSLGMTVMAAEENNDWFQKRYEFRKGYINQKLEEGLITEKQAEYMLDRLEAAKKYHQENGNKLEERYELRKDYIKKQLEKGLITKDQADYMLKQLEERKEYYKQGYPSMMSYREMGFGPMKMGPGMMNFRGSRFGRPDCGRMHRGRGRGSGQKGRW